MKARILFIGIINVFLWSCKPEPFRTELVGYKIQFPITLAELQNIYPNGHTVDYNKFVDSNQSIRVEWWFNDWGNSGNKYPTNQPHGVVVFLKNKGVQFDSVKTALEKHYKRSFEPLKIRYLRGDFTNINPHLYVCHINNETILTLSKAVQGDSWAQYNSIKISLGYNLTNAEEEIFALLGGSIYDDKLSKRLF